MISDEMVERLLRPAALPPLRQPVEPTARWWAQRWLDSASPDEIQAMRELLFADDGK